MIIRPISDFEAPLSFATEVRANRQLAWFVIGTREFTSDSNNVSFWDLAKIPAALAQQRPIKKVESIAN
jgi:hypothetical protein